MASGLQSSGAIKMSEIREEFLDDATNNRLNEYGAGDSGLTPQNKGSGTQRKFSDYYNREYKVIKELTNPATQLPITDGFYDYYDVKDLFTQKELDAPNNKVINVRDPGVPIGLPPIVPGTNLGNSGLYGVLRINLSSFAVQGAITLNNYAKIYAPGGTRQDYNDVGDFYSRNGGNAITVESPASGFTSYNLTINNFGELRGGGGAGAYGGKGGNGQYSNEGVLTESVGGNGGYGGAGRGYQTTSPYYVTTITGGAGLAGGINAGTGGPGGSGGDWAQNGNSGNAGTSGTIGGTQNIGGITISYTVGAGGEGGYGSGGTPSSTTSASAGYGGSGGMTTVTIGNTVYAAPGGGGGAWNGIGGAGTFAPTNTSTGGPAQYATSITQAWSCGNGYSSGFGGGGGGALGQRNASSQNGAIANIDAGTSYSRFLGTILNTVINSSGGAPEYESPYLNNSSNYGRYMAQQVNGAALDGGSPARWGGGGGGGSYSGGNGGNGNLGGGGGGAAGGSRQTALWWRNTDPGNRTLTDALSRNGALYISVKIRQGSPWGNSFESSEGIDVQYSLNNGSTWTSMAYISSDIGTFDWHVAKYKVPLEARGSGVRFRVNQRPWTSTIDQWACGDGQIHYADGSVDVLWTPASIPGLYWYASGTQDTDYSLSETPPGYTGYVAPIASRGGNGGSGFVLFGFVSGNGVQYVLRTSGSGTVTVPANTDKILCWAVGGGGGGGGAPADSVSEGGGGASGSINYFEIDNVAGDLGVNTTGSSGSTSYGLAGKAVFFKDNRKPTFTLNNNGIISGSYT